MSKPKRLHPLAAVLNFLKQLKELFIPLVVLLFLNNGEKEGDIWYYLPYIGMAAVIMFVLISGVVKWIRFTYRVEDGELRIEHGLFVKKKRYIPLERIQSLDVSEGVLQRIFSLVKIKIETAGSADHLESEADLTAISKFEAEQLQALIRKEKRNQLRDADAVDMEGEESGTDQSATIVHQSKLFDLIFLAITSGGAGVVISGVIAFLSQFQEIIPYEKLFKRAEHIVEDSLVFLAAAAFLVLFLAWLVSIAMTLLKYSDFTLKTSEEQLIITHGLLEKRQVMIPMHRIQGITLAENPIRQLFGYASVQIESAGGSLDEQGSSSVKIMPMIKKREALRVLGVLFPDHHFSNDFHPIPARSSYRYMFRKMLWLVGPCAVVSWLFWPLGMWSILLILPAWGLGWFCYRSAGWELKGNQLSIRYRTFSRYSVYMKKHRIQSFEHKQTWRQKQQSLATIGAVIKVGAGGKNVHVIDAAADDAMHIYNWYQTSKTIERVVDIDD
ncbi:putative membrane protein [Bacillus ectoiniformans]|uniref:PH domain-containing protein n=1 Tax=Bacillus ectoiniformans TaxID=1494429 RepID=UPI00195DE64D|nr:PH domain-containing protein [Bacillus ectoiniformans]MBM7649401.1 putative membrane protein [Bacillus ectoiniformans]